MKVVVVGSAIRDGGSVCDFQKTRDKDKLAFIRVTAQRVNATFLSQFHIADSE